jgi:predicted nucleic acid-binding protein
VDVLVDTSVWSLVLRRQESARLSSGETRSREELTKLISEKRVQIIGPIRQEILSGIRHHGQYERIRIHLRQFEDEPLTTSDFEMAAAHWNTCRTKGVIGSPVDYLICAVALSRNWSVFTVDRDFERLDHILRVQLHAPRNLNPLH